MTHENVMHSDTDGVIEHAIDVERWEESNIELEKEIRIKKCYKCLS